jgi:hypothetical protein
MINHIVPLHPAVKAGLWGRYVSVNEKKPFGYT